jgi:acyl carrier protein
MTETADTADAAVREILRDALGIPADRVAAFGRASPLFGAVPELDSMAVANLLTEMEDRLGIFIDDDEIDGEMLETFGGLVDFAARKLAG